MHENKTNKSTLEAILELLDECAFSDNVRINLRQRSVLLVALISLCLQFFNRKQKYQLLHALNASMKQYDLKLIYSIRKRKPKK